MAIFNAWGITSGLFKRPGRVAFVAQSRDPRASHSQKPPRDTQTTPVNQPGRALPSLRAACRLPFSCLPGTVTLTLTLTEEVTKSGREQRAAAAMEPTHTWRRQQQWHPCLIPRAASFSITLYI